MADAPDPALKKGWPFGWLFCRRVRRCRTLKPSIRAASSCRLHLGITERRAFQAETRSSDRLAAQWPNPDSGPVGFTSRIAHPTRDHSWCRADTPSYSMPEAALLTPGSILWPLSRLQARFQFGCAPPVLAPRVAPSPAQVHKLHSRPSSYEKVRTDLA